MSLPITCLSARRKGVGGDGARLGMWCLRGDLSAQRARHRSSMRGSVAIGVTQCR